MLKFAALFDGNLSIFAFSGKFTVIRDASPHSWSSSESALLITRFECFSSEGVLDCKVRDEFFDVVAFRSSWSDSVTYIGLSE